MAAGFAVRSALVGFVLKKAGFQQLSVSVRRGSLVKITVLHSFLLTSGGRATGPLESAVQRRRMIIPSQQNIGE